MCSYRRRLRGRVSEEVRNTKSFCLYSCSVNNMQNTVIFRLFYLKSTKIHESGHFSVISGCFSHTSIACVAVNAQITGRSLFQ